MQFYGAHPGPYTTTESLIADAECLCGLTLIATHGRCGSWLRENVLAGADTSEHQLTNSGTGKTCHVLAITSWNRLYRLPGRCERSGGGVENMGAPMPSPHARIPAMTGCTPTTFITRARS